MRFTARSSAFIRAPQQVVYSVLTGYRQYEMWVPDVTHSRLLAKEGELAIAELIAPPYGAEKLVLETIESPHDSLAFTQADRYRQDGVFGRFQLVAADDAGGTMVTALLGARVAPYRFTCRKSLWRVLDRTLTALGDRAIKLLTSGLAEMPDQRAKLLEIDIAGRSVTMRVGGATYELARRREETSA